MWTETKIGRRLQRSRFPTGGSATSRRWCARTVNHPSVDPLLDRQRDPRRLARRTAAALGRAARREGPVARRHPVRDQRRSTAMLVAGPDRRADPRGARQLDVDEETGINTMMHRLGELMDEPMQLAEWSATTDRGGVRVPRRGRLQLHGRPLRDGPRAASRNRVIVGSRDLSRARSTGAGPVVTGNPPRHRRLHLDRLGLPRRGRHRPGRATATTPTPGMSGFHGDYPWLAAHVRRHRHHRPPPPGVVLPGDRLRPARRPLHRRAAARAPRQAGRATPAPGRGATRSSSWTWAGARGQAGHRRGVRRRRRGRAAGQRRVARAGSRPATTHRFRAEFETTYAAGRAGRGGLRATARRPGA